MIQATNIYLGNEEITAAYLGDIKVWGGSQPIVENNVIYYLSTNEKIVEPYRTDGFGVNIVSNTYKDGQGKIVFDGDVTSIGDMAFYGCNLLTFIILPPTVSSIGEDAFKYCLSLKSINIPESVTGIGSYAFDNCVSLKSVIIPSTVTTIEYGTFIDCTALESVTISKGVKYIDKYGFYDCIALKSVIIPSTVTFIGDFAFSNCRILSDIYCEGVVAPSVDDNTFKDIKAGGTLHYPAGSDYSTWLSNGIYYLGHYNWTGVADL